MACDLLMNHPWQCGENDCGAPGGWHQSGYWIDDQSSTGYTLDNYSDGDHDECEEGDIPSADDTAKAWREYAEWVAEHGVDPLGEFCIPPDPERKFVARFVNSILGLMLVGVRTGGGRAMNLSKLPAQVTEYLEVDRKGSRLIQRDWKNIAEVRVSSFGDVFTFRRGSMHVHFSVRIPRPEAQTQRLIRKAAKTHC